MGQRSKTFSTKLYEVIYEVEEKDHGIRLDQFLAQFFSSFSRVQIKKKIQRGDIKILDRKHPNKASIKVYHREQVRVQTKSEDASPPTWNNQSIELQDPSIVFEDEDLLIINKPPYMATHPTGRYLFYTATTFFEEKLDQRIHSIHRLDRETSGCLILGKSPAISQKFMNYFEEGKIKKAYFFIAHEKEITEENFLIDKRLGEISDYVPRLYAHCFDKDSKQGKHASTYFKKIHTEKDFGLYLAYPITGRPHQIRAHANFAGLPLVGDKLYLDPEIFIRFQNEQETEDDFSTLMLSRQALHAMSIQIPHRNQSQIFQAELPADIFNWIKENLSPMALEKIESKALFQQISQGFQELRQYKLAKKTS